MADGARLICPASELEEGGRGVRFTVTRHGREEAAFVVRYEGEPRAFLNRCAHVPMELDWQPGVFFDASGLYLLCATHGATYDPATGACLGGPCRGRGLVPLAVAEAEGSIVLTP
jgi:nitrite reductase/ring-hydroxylating ferredoxin subunit